MLTPHAAAPGKGAAGVYVIVLREMAARISNQA
jgi:hypothetical protein